MHLRSKNSLPVSIGQTKRQGKIKKEVKEPMLQKPISETDQGPLFSRCYLHDLHPFGYLAQWKRRDVTARR